MRKLPVIDAFSHALRSTQSNLAFAFHISWPWMAILLPIFLITAYLSRGQSSGAELISGIIAMIAFSSIAVNWHRYVLLDEVPRGGERLRLDTSVWRYFGNLLLIAIIIAAALAAIAIPLIFLAIVLFFGATSDMQNSAVIAILLLPLLLVVGTALFYRLGPKLPAVALGRGDFGLADAWRATAGNTLAITGVGILYLLIGAALGLAMGLVAAGLSIFGTTIGVPIYAIIQFALNWVLTILGITLLTSLYGFFVEGRNF